MAKTIDLPLNELYAKKITKSVEVAIQSKEDFSKISTDYCSTICKLKCKQPSKVRLVGSEEIDILIIQDHSAPKGKYDRTDNGQEVIQRGIIEFICEKAGFNGLKYRITNLLKCAPTEIDFPKGKPPSITVLSKCKPYLLDEIRRSKPKIIISLSTAVTKALGYTKHSNTNNRGEVVDNVLITLHPRVLSMIRQNASGAMWGNDYFNIIKKDFEKAARIARKQLTIGDLGEAIERQRKNIMVCRSLDDVRSVVDTIVNLPDGYLVSVDTETTGLDPMSDTAKLLCIQFGWKNPQGTYVAAVIPLWHRENKMYNASPAWQMLSPILMSKGIKKILHNAKFDILYIYHTTGIRMEGVEFDTMLMMHALDSGIQGCLSLKTAVWDLCPDLGIGGYETLLPPLTKVKSIEDPDGEVSEEEEIEEVEE
jgi:uracil-DNA glycosylase family 4